MIPPEQPKQLADTVIALEGDRARLHQLAMASGAAAAVYSRKNQADKMIGFLETVANII